MTIRASLAQAAIVIAEIVGFVAMMAVIFFGIVAIGALMGAPT
jgi:hypothetical protein